MASTAINFACRLVEAEALKHALAGSRGVLAVIASQWFFEEVVRHTPASAPASYRRVQVVVKETRDTGWICLPDDPYPPGEGPRCRWPRRLRRRGSCPRLSRALPAGWPSWKR